MARDIFKKQSNYIYLSLQSLKCQTFFSTQQQDTVTGVGYLAEELEA